MNLKASILWLSTLVLVYPVPARAGQGRWQGHQDNKPRAELEALDNFALASEGRKACTAGAIAGQFSTPAEQQRGAEARAYLETLGRIARRTQGSQAATWVLQMLVAIDRQDPYVCIDSWQHVWTEQLERILQHQKRKR